jgi:hypothetical protein
MSVRGRSKKAPQANKKLVNIIAIKPNIGDPHFVEKH